MRTSNVTVVPAQTASTSESTTLLNTAKYSKAIVTATNLAGAEDVEVLMKSGGNYVSVTDAAGDPLFLTATVPSTVLEGGPIYAFAKDETAGACAILAVLQRNK
jgi:hypothetical protein